MEQVSTPGRVDRVSLFHRALEAQDESSVKSMLSLYEELEPNAVLPGLTMSLLHLAVGFSDNSPKIVYQLLEKGGNPNNMKTATGEKISPLHLSVIYDYDEVLQLLIQYGGDPTLCNSEEKNCYDLAKDNVEEEMREKCFLYFYRKSLTFRKSIKPSDSIVKIWKDKHEKDLSLTSLSDGVSCASFDFKQENPVDTENQSIEEAELPELDLVPDPISPSQDPPFKYLITEEPAESDATFEKRLSTIEEESALSVSFKKMLGYEETLNGTGYERIPVFSRIRSLQHQNPGSSSSRTETTSLNCTPPVLKQPSKADMQNLENMMKNARVTPKNTIPVTPSTFQVLNRVAQENKLAQVLTPKANNANFSPELTLAIHNLHLIDEWGNLKVNLVQSLSTDTPKNKSKSYYNYLLLDPKVIKRTNFCGTHLKSDVIRNSDKFETFLKSIFYIGKGCGKRPIQHLVDAKEKYGNGRQKIQSWGSKIDKIIDTWKSGLGVIVVSLFLHSSEKEANINEASMIDAMGLPELSNLKRGSYSGLASSWPQKSKNQFGSFLLYKAFCTFAVSDHKYFYPQDV